MNKKEAEKILYETLGNYSDKGSELLFKCPECGHHKRKFSINLDKNVYSVGFAIIAVVILGALLDVLVRIHNYRNGTQLRTGQILKDLLTSLWNQSLERARRNLNSRKNS